MQLVLLRHATTADTGRRLTGRGAGVALDRSGRHAARDLAARLVDLDVAALYTSPVKRCRETANILGQAWNVPRTVLPAVTEVDYGDWTGRSLASVRRTRLWATVQSAPSRATFSGGESLVAVQHRAVAAIEHLSRSHGKRRVVVVSHADVIKAILIHYLGAPFDMLQRIAVSPLGVSSLQLDAGAPPRIHAINTAWHER